MKTSRATRDSNSVDRPCGARAYKNLLSALTSDVLEGRQTPADIPEAELRAAFERIVSLFKDGWLRADSPGALQALWKRCDITATWELFWLGTSLARLAPINSGWLAGQVNIVKTGQRNERIGSLFEILALALFSGSAHDVVATRKNQPGYDGTLLFNGGHVGRVSLKNFARSFYQKQFDTNAATTLSQFKAALGANRRAWLGIAAFSETYPSDADWGSLREHLTNRITAGGSADAGQSEQVGPWSLVYTSPPNDASLHAAYSSYTVQIAAKHHRNESKNVEDSFVKALANFDEHVQGSVNGSTNAMLIRLGEAFFVPGLAQWTRDYVDRVGTHLDEILLYQPAIALNTTTSGTSIVHHMTLVKIGNTHHPVLSASAPVGTVAGTPTRTILIAGKREIPLQHYHVFQRGEVYHAGEMQIGKESSLPMDFGPGIIAHNVLRILDDNDGIVFSPRHPLSWDLSLLND